VTTELPHPTEPDLGEVPPAGFVRVERIASPEEYWHFSMWVSAEAAESVAGDVAPSERERSVTLSCHRRDVPKSEVEVIGHFMRHEVSAADWLDAELDRLGHRVASRRTALGDAASAGDVLASWEHEGERFVGRFVAMKWGPRLYVVCGRALERDYARCAAGFWVTSASLRPLLSWPSPWVEELVTVQEDAPFEWRASLPASWELRRHPAGEEGAWVDALHLAPAPPDEQLGEHDGRLTLAVMTRQRARRPRDAANVYLRALRAAEMHIDPADFEDEPVEPPFAQGWYLVANVEKNGAPGELRCRVWMHEHAWVLAAVFGARRDDDRGAWMRNKRALDVATATLELDTRL